MILRDGVVASNVSAIASGVIAHYLADHFGSVGPFQGAVCCTAMALLLVFHFWDENYGLVSPGEKNIVEILRKFNCEITCLKNFTFFFIFYE